MADNGEVQAHEATYSGFMTMLKWGTLITAVIVAFVVLLIAS